ncbi:F420-dependent NADP reductase [Frankia sp. AiPs1]|uniref:NADPH-dependent F420 reductase n=1 Tax=Frankia sp. AiPa1 TaxID=573492 RepID=UPI00202ACB06|nr:NADPH-dependent F420 reductase [Frankia sp. AiPa1]MCL9759602.1 NADPH-dependent F420 reductase [Frankia sp. AiPa1]
MTSTQYVPADVPALTVGILGGSGPQGGGLGLRFAQAGHLVLIGSRSAERGEQAAAALAGPGRRIEGSDNATVAARADIVIIAVPWEGHRETLESLRGPLAGKIVIDCVNPMGFDKGGAFALPVPEGSAAQQAAAVLPDSTVVAAFHHISAVLLADESVESIDTDILVLGDDRAATDLVAALAERIPGMRGIYAGKLRNAGQVEALTANLISINRRYKSHAGLRVTDV